MLGGQWTWWSRAPPSMIFWQDSGGLASLERSTVRRLALSGLRIIPSLNSDMGYGVSSCSNIEGTLSSLPASADNRVKSMLGFTVTDLSLIFTVFIFESRHMMRSLHLIFASFIAVSSRLTWILWPISSALSHDTSSSPLIQVAIDLSWLSFEMKGLCSFNHW